MSCCGSWEVRERGLYDLTEGKTYNHDSKADIRTKFILLSAGGQFLLGSTCQISHHFIDLFSGNWVRRGRSQAEVEWRQDKFLRHEVVESSKKVPLGYVFKRTLFELITVICKIAIFPIYLIGRQIIALFGIVSPYNGRRWYAKIEDWMKVSQNGIEHRDLLCILFQYSAPCMQPRENHLKNNNFRPADSGLLHQIRQAILQNILFIEKNRFYLDKDLSNQLTTSFERKRRDIVNIEEEEMLGKLDRIFGELKALRDERACLKDKNRVKEQQILDQIRQI